MKIALHFFGHLRSYKICMPFIKKNLTKDLECDVFLHTWNKLYPESNTSKDVFNSSSVENLHPAPYVTDVDILNIKNIYNSLTFNIESQDDYLNLNESNFFRLNMLHKSIRTSTCLRLNSKKAYVEYDAIIYIRPDILLKTIFPLIEIIDLINNEAFENKIITLPYVYQSPSFWINDQIGARDCFFICSQNTSLKFTSIGLKNIYKSHDSIHRKGEEIFEDFLAQSQLRSVYFKYTGPNSWEILRL
jgi:hypothetical protein